MNGRIRSFILALLSVVVMEPAPVVAQSTTTNCTDWGYSIRCTTRPQPRATNPWLGAIVGGLNGLAADQQRRRQEEQALQERQFLEAVLRNQQIMNAEAAATAAASARLFNNRAGDVLNLFADSLGLLDQSYAALVWNSDPILQDLLMVDPRANYEAISEELRAVFRDFERKHERFEELWVIWLEQTAMSRHDLSDSEIVEFAGLVVELRDQYLAGAVAPADDVIVRTYTEWLDRRQQLAIAEEDRVRALALEEEARVREDAIRNRERGLFDHAKDSLETLFLNAISEAPDEPWLADVEEEFRVHLYHLLDEGPARVREELTKHGLPIVTEIYDEEQLEVMSARNLLNLAMLQFRVNRNLCVPSESGFVASRSSCNPDWLDSVAREDFERQGQMLVAEYTTRASQISRAAWDDAGLPGIVYPLYREALIEAGRYWLEERDYSIAGEDELVVAMSTFVNNIAMAFDFCNRLDKSIVKNFTLDELASICSFELHPAQQDGRLHDEFLIQVQARANTPRYRSSGFWGAIAVGVVVVLVTALLDGAASAMS